MQITYMHNKDDVNVLLSFSFFKSHRYSQFNLMLLGVSCLKNIEEDYKQIQSHSLCCNYQTLTSGPPGSFQRMIF